MELRWVAQEPLVIDPSGNQLHRMWCPYVDDKDGTTGLDVAAGDPLPGADPPAICPRCLPQLFLE